MTYKVDHRTERIKIFIMTVDPYHIGIHMKRKELTKTFINPLISMVYGKLLQRCKG